MKCNACGNKILTKEQYDEMLTFYINRAEDNKTSYHVWRAIACVALGILAYIVMFILGYLLLTKI